MKEPEPGHLSSASDLAADTASGAEEEAASGIEEETASRIEEETASRIEEETVSGVEEETVSGVEEETTSGVEEETASGVEKEITFGVEAETASNVKEKIPFGEGLPLAVFSDEIDEATFHFQILKLTNQLYIWIGCNSARLGHLYASFPSPFDKTPSLTTLIGGGADSIGASMARRLSLKTGWSIILAANLPSNSPSMEAFAEKRLLQELKALGYVKSRSVPGVQWSEPAQS